MARVEVYPGNYEDYLWRKQGGAEKLQATVSQSHRNVPSNGHPPELVDVDGSKAKRLNPIKRKQMEDRFSEVEQAIADLESAIVHCEESLQTFVSAEETQRITQELAENREKTPATYGRVGRIRTDVAALSH